MRVPGFIIDWLTSKREPADHNPPRRYATREEMKRRNERLTRQSEELSVLFAEVNQMYQARGCPCAFPRFQQIVGIDCSRTGDAYRCYDTESLIRAVQGWFTESASDRKDESVNKRWTCRHCGSVYELGWSDFSIAVDREKLQLVELRAISIGKAAQNPVPLYMGAMGHSLPGDSESVIVGLQQFRRYMLELG